MRMTKPFNGYKQPSKFEIEQWLDEIAYSYDKVFHVMLLCDSLYHTYRARVCLEGREPISVTRKHWEYHEILLEVEKLLDEFN